MEDEFSCPTCGALQLEGCGCELLGMDATRLAARAWNIEIPRQIHTGKKSTATEFSDEVEKYVKLLGFKTRRKK